MLKEEVRIKIRSELYEVEESLFSDLPEDEDEIAEAIAEAVADGEGEKDILEINSLGSYSFDGERITISYDETEVTGMEGSSTAVSFLESETGVVSMIREGAVSTVLVFESGKRHHCVYNTPYMPFEVCVHTLKVDNRLMEEGYLDLDYVIEIRGAQAERTKFRMEIR